MAERAGVWEVMLGGSYKPYDDPAVQQTLEAAYTRGATTADVTVRGTVYEVSLKGDALQQRQKNDPTRTRQVRRVAAAAAAPSVAAPAAAPAAPPVATASSSSPAAGSKRKRAPTAFVFAPGAGGAAAREMVKLHGKLEAAGDAVVRVEGWPRGLNPASNCGHVLAAAAAAHAAHPGSAVVLCGASFGCRVVAEVMARDPPPYVSRTIVLCGYPLIGQSGSSTDRTGHLLRLPADVRACFVEGDKDPFLGPTGLASLREVAGRMAASHELHVVAHGGHTVPQAGALKSRGLTQDLVTESVAEAIRGFAA